MGASRTAMVRGTVLVETVDAARVLCPPRRREPDRTSPARCHRICPLCHLNQCITALCQYHRTSHWDCQLQFEHGRHARTAWHVGTEFDNATFMPTGLHGSIAPRAWHVGTVFATRACARAFAPTISTRTRARCKTHANAFALTSILLRVIAMGLQPRPRGRFRRWPPGGSSGGPKLIFCSQRFPGEPQRHFRFSVLFSIS